MKDLCNLHCDALYFNRLAEFALDDPAELLKIRDRVNASRFGEVLSQIKFDVEDFQEVTISKA